MRGIFSGKRVVSAAGQFGYLRSRGMLRVVAERREKERALQYCDLLRIIVTAKFKSKT